MVDWTDERVVPQREARSDLRKGILSNAYLGRVWAVARRATRQSLAVLEALLIAGDRWRHGYELAGEVGLKSGSLYPILARLAEQGLLEASWESDPPPGRPRRHLYRLTAAGEAATHARGRTPASRSDSTVVPGRSPRPATSTPTSPRPGRRRAGNAETAWAEG